MTKAIFVGDIVNPETGKTLKEENLEKTHKYPLGSLVEYETGIRLFVVAHRRDCDGSPLYGLSFDRDLDTTKIEYPGRPSNGIEAYSRAFSAGKQAGMEDGPYGEESLILIR